MVDTSDSKSDGASRGGSSPPAGTTLFKQNQNSSKKIYFYTNFTNIVMIQISIFHTKGAFMHTNIKKLLQEKDVKTLKDLSYLISEEEVEALHKKIFRVKPKSFGMLGLHSPSDYVEAVLTVINEGIPYNEEKYLIDQGWTKKRIYETIWG